MNKESSNGKMDKEAIKHAIKTRYLNSYKVIIAGGRDFDNYEYLKEKLDETFNALGDLDAHPIEIISGMADGADSLGIKYAKEHKLTMVLYPANWDKYPRMAGIHACYGNTSCRFLGWQVTWNQAHDRNCQGKGHTGMDI